MAKKKTPSGDEIDIVKLNNSDNLFNFLKKSYDEAINLTAFSRDYFNARGRLDKMKLSKEESIIYTLAMSTITTQLTSVLGWLLMCRAVQEGEVKMEDLRNEDFRMPEFELGVDDPSSCFANLQPPVSEILKKSSSLYNRVKRMEQSIQHMLTKIDEPF